ncbi:MAG: HlyD family type I secretion periplasmic adaptor subunit (plasmid) [Leptolyngbya sp. BL-A-14]
MKTSPSSAPIQLKQTKQQFTTVEGYLSYELGNAVQSLPPLFTRLLAGGLSLLFVSALTWAAVSQIDEVADTQGQLIPANPVQPMHALAGGRLKEIKVTERQHVQAGDLLIQLDPTLSQAEVQRLEQLVTLNREELARLEAERTGKTQAGEDLQNQLLAARLKEFRDRRSAAAAEANRQQSMLQAARVQLSRLQEDLNYANTREQSLQALLAPGAIPRLDYLEARNKVTGLQKELAMQSQQIEQAQQSYQAAKDSMNRLDAERQSDILTQITKQRQELADLENKLTQAREQNRQNTIQAPVTGYVYNIQIDKTGGTVQPGGELLSIAPDGEELLVEAKVSNRDIGFVQRDMPAKVKLATFPYQEFGTLDGTVESISPNAIRDKEGNLLYSTRIRLKQHSVNVHGQEVPLAPGMAASAEIVIRQKSVMTFLLEPIIANWDKAFSIR